MYHKITTNFFLKLKTIYKCFLCRPYKRHISMLCFIAGLCGSQEKCDRNYLVSKFVYVHNIQSRVKQEVNMPQIQKCVTRYSSPYWCSVPNIRKLASVVPEKNVTEIYCDADDARRRKTYMSPPLKRAGDTIT